MSVTDEATRQRALSTVRQAAGSAAIVIGGFWRGFTFGGLGWSTASLNQ